MPFDGQNPRSIVIMDHASIHHVGRIQDIITGVGARLMYLPPYSPDLMPLEEVFANNDSAYISTHSPELFVRLAFCKITKDDCIAYIRHAGYI